LRNNKKSEVGPYLSQEINRNGVTRIFGYVKRIIEVKQKNKDCYKKTDMKISVFGSDQIYTVENNQDNTGYQIHTLETCSIV